MKYTLQNIDSITVLIVDADGAIVGEATHLFRGVWNIFTPDLQLVGTCQGKGMIVDTFRGLMEQAMTNSVLKFELSQKSTEL